MKYINIFLIVFLLYMSFLIARSIARTNRIYEKHQKSFWEKESQANFTRSRDISNLDYIRLPLDQLPLKDAILAGCGKEVEELKKFSEKNIINLSGYTNTDLKLMYGPANLEALTQCDNDYTSLIRLLNHISSMLVEKDMTDSARKFLEYSITIGSDISSTYVNLGKIYMDLNQPDKVKDLMAQAASLTSLSGKTILAKLEKLLNT